MNVWRSLVLEDIDPRTLIKPHAIWRRRALLPKAGPFLLELVLGSLGIVFLGFGAAVLSFSHQGVVGLVAATLGLLGVTIAGLQAAIKASALGLISQLKRAVYIDLAGEAVTRIPRPQPVPAAVAQPNAMDRLARNCCEVVKRWSRSNVESNVPVTLSPTPTPQPPK